MGGFTTGRVEAFSDGVLAIIITILVLEFQVPEVADGESLWRALGHEWPSYAAYVVSYATVGIMWINHHRLFDRVGSVDRGLLGRNLCLLAGTSVLPFTTALVAEYLTDDAGRAAVVIYASNLVFTGLCFNVLWLHLRDRPELLAEGVDPAVPALALRRSVVGPVAYGVAALFALVAPWLTLAIIGSLAVYFALYRV